MAAKAAEPPVILGDGGNGYLIAMPEGVVDMVYQQATSDGLDIVRKRSTDNGRTWSSPEVLFPIDPEKFGGRLPLTSMPLLTEDGRMQLFWLAERGGGGMPAVDYFIDIKHVCSTEPVTAFGPTVPWSGVQNIFDGYVGSINGMVQLSSGRIVVPFAYWVANQPPGPPCGNNIVTTVYSDDGGVSWSQSAAKITAPCYPDYNGDNLGAIEPTIVQLGDGRVWMLIRTQTGRLYESFSPDGIDWSPATPSRFFSTDSPAGMAKLHDGRIVLFWNNCENTSRINGQGVYTNRDALHAAISSDDGKTWRGFREIYLDPFRNDSPPRGGDRGTAYPFAIATPDNHILLITGQGEGRRNLLTLDPNWLEETRAEDDFTEGLSRWSVFKSFGEPAGWWRDRVEGAKLVDHPDKPGAKALHVRRPDEKDGDGAVWNFPAGCRGVVQMSLLLKEGFQGGSIALADRFIQPTDGDGEINANLFVLPINPEGRLPGGKVIEPGHWHQLSLSWNMEQGQCTILLDGQQAGALPLLHDDPTSFGISYLRLRSTAPGLDTAGMLIEWVRADVTTPEPSAMIQIGTAIFGAIAYGWAKSKG